MGRVQTAWKEWLENLTHSICSENFFLVEFKEAKDRDISLSYATWFYGRKYLDTFPWEPNFDVTTGNYHMLPV